MPHLPRADCLCREGVRVAVSVLRGDGSDESRRWRMSCTGLYGAPRRECALADGFRPTRAIVATLEALFCLRYVSQ